MSDLEQRFYASNREIVRLGKENDALAAEVTETKAENRRLREALLFISRDVTHKYPDADAYPHAYRRAADDALYAPNDNCAEEKKP